MKSPVALFVAMKIYFNKVRIIKSYIHEMEKSLDKRDIDGAMHWSLKIVSTITQLKEEGK